MLKKVFKFFVAKNVKKKDLDFFSLTVSEQKKIISKAAEKANKDQSALIMKYNRELNRVSSGNCK